MHHYRRLNLLLPLLLSLGACAARDAPRSAQDAMAASRAADASSAAAHAHPAGCYDAAGRPLRPDPADPRYSADPSCPRPGPTALRSRRGASRSGTDPVFDPGSVNLPSMPAPVPAGLGVFR